jgi:hypothetical protein
VVASSLPRSHHQLGAVRRSRGTRGPSDSLGDLLNEWHDRYGTRFPQSQCAGCGAPIGGIGGLDLADGHCVHFGDTLDCLLAFGKRWRKEATAGLRALKLDPPDGFEPL